MIWVWLGAIVVFGVAELITEGMVSIWFVAGALAALAASMIDLPVSVQVLAFVIVSAIALAASRPLVRRFLNRPGIPTNADRIVGMTAQVVEPVDNEKASGAVYVDGKTWTARSTDGHSIPAGTQVQIQRIEGVKLIVNVLSGMEAVK
ncbi:MAG: NfeD family protein [Oscillibacter sp.]|nr:NfeD family protein [Oscillibacter sp.]MCI9374993.1 NfeD family protein [Oscillibacter sp.]